MEKPASKKLIAIAAAVFIVGVLAFLLWLRGSFHSVHRVTLPQDGGAYSAASDGAQIECAVFETQLTAGTLTITGRAAKAGEPVRRFHTRVVLRYTDGSAWQLPTRMDSSELYYDNSCFYAMAPVAALPAGEAELWLLFADGEEDRCVNTSVTVTTGGDGV